MASILDTLVDKQGGTQKSASWYQKAVASMADRLTANKLMSQGKLTSRPNIGLLNLFFYDPKYKKTLPYYDTFPLVLPLEAIPGGFSGLNFHYLPPGLRFRLLDQIQRFATNNKMDSTTRLNVSYSGVKSIPLVKPTIKKYLYKHVRSSFLKIDLTQAALAVYLPVQQFKKSSDAAVYAAARRVI
jgi:hypothetical protein